MEKMTDEQMLALAREVLQTDDVASGDAGYWENVRAFEINRVRFPANLSHLRSLFIDPYTRRYARNFSWEPDSYCEALGDFAAGMQFPLYSLEVTQIYDWPRTQVLFGCLGFSPAPRVRPSDIWELTLFNWFNAAPCPVRNSVVQAEQVATWDEVSATTIERALAMEPLVFEGASLLGDLQYLCAAIHFDCFDWQIRGLNRETELYSEEVTLGGEGVDYWLESYEDMEADNVVAEFFGED